MIEIGNQLVNRSSIVRAEIDTRFYVNGSASYLVVHLNDGSIIREEHRASFNVFEKYDEIKGGK